MRIIHCLIFHLVIEELALCSIPNSNIPTKYSINNPPNEECGVTNCNKCWLNVTDHCVECKNGEYVSIANISIYENSGGDQCVYNCPTNHSAANLTYDTTTPSIILVNSKLCIRDGLCPLKDFCPDNATNCNWECTPAADRCLSPCLHCFPEDSETNLKCLQCSNNYIGKASDYRWFYLHGAQQCSYSTDCFDDEAKMSIGYTYQEAVIQTHVCLTNGICPEYDNEVCPVRTSKCKMDCKEPAKKYKFPTWAIFLSIFGGIFILSSIISIFCICCKRKKRQEEEEASYRPIQIENAETPS